jgi:hypothetical protein
MEIKECPVFRVLHQKYGNGHHIGIRVLLTGISFFTERFLEKIINCHKVVASSQFASHKAT